jgi:hypothetical protein
VRANFTGKLTFWADDGCTIRLDGLILHQDVRAHPATRCEIDVRRGDVLQIAQWQKDGEWVWGARSACAGIRNDTLWSHYEAALERMGSPDGPPLKIYTNAASPLRTVVSIYSLILNGYVPSRVLIFGEHQWSDATRDLLSSMLPFAEIVSTDELNHWIRTYGGTELVERAMQHWWVMKTLVSLLFPPDEFCALDDDVFVLDHTRDALRAFETHDLVFAEDINHEEEYASAWEPIFGRLPLSETGRFNAGLYWMRNSLDPSMVADFALRVSPRHGPEYVWEQGFIANLFAQKSLLRLPRQRYFYPIFGGLPGGMLGYDYRENPCGFASIHFGGLREKPTDLMALALASEILPNSEISRAAEPGLPAATDHRPIQSWREHRV